MFLAVDGDILLYRAASAAETEIDWGEDIWSLYRLERCQEQLPASAG